MIAAEAVSSCAWTWSRMGLESGVADCPFFGGLYGGCAWANCPVAADSTKSPVMKGATRAISVPLFWESAGDRIPLD